MRFAKLKKVIWFVAIWGISVLILGLVAYGIRSVIGV
ncbi:uncharacterized protein DUF2474 [Pacificibacter maritimus]|uniref:Uncharacterized protein DUF2474 n=1 Tax=Pacificibacter maritimus TaxID=762213 RepID=A0A3N4VCV7_9RHOB|nr:DUF2474 family protein [Pacificibacter maritimus]RPE71680.1 uncharacterized protein DUF2474 [Pacificibacter maritimus]